MKIEEFEARHVDEASSLLARSLARELPAKLGALDATQERCAEWIAAALEAGAGGVAVVDRRGVAGYLLAVEGDNDRGRHVWSARECHAYRDDPEALRVAYASVAQGWVDDGRDHHYAVVSATDLDELRAWFELCFGHEQAHAIQEIEDRPGFHDLPVELRRATPDDLEAIAPLVRLIYESHRGAPVFTYIEPEWWDELLPGHKELLEDPAVGYWIALANNRALGYAAVRPVHDDESSLLKPKGTIELNLAATLPQERSRGIMKALTQRALAWSRAEGFTVCVTDWRVANLQSSRAWPRLGFTPVAYRLHRIIDPRVMTARRQRV
jgi:ribosomal protein S18 acetylase RimI-like enzyme